MISTSGYYAPEAVAARLQRAKARAKKLEALASSIATQKNEKARAVAKRRCNRYADVVRWRARGLDWTQVGKKLGITRQGARFIYDTFSPNHRRAATSPAPSSASPEAAPSAKSSNHNQSA